MSDKKYLETFTSPVGVAVFPWITKADVQHDAAGVFHTDMSVSPDEQATVDFIATLENVLNEFADKELTIAQKAALTAREVYKDEFTRPEFPEGATDDQKAAIKADFVPEPTGLILFRFKMKNNVTTAAGESFSQTPVVVMADTGAACESPVYGGSIIRVRGQIVPYTNASAGNFGVTLRMKAVQVIDLVTGEGGNSAHWTNFDGDEVAA